MVTVQLKGVHVVSMKLASGRREYHYAWRGGPRLKGDPGSPEYLQSHQDAHRARKAPLAGTFREIITAYRASPNYKRLGAHTTRAYAKHLSTIEAKWGTLPVAALDDPQVRKKFIAWRDSMAATPRSADMAIGVLKALLKWAVEGVMITTDQAKPISRLHRADKSDAIWTADELERFGAQASRELLWAVELALYTGLRQSDLIRLAWNHEKDGAFGFLTSKRGRMVTIPITPACRALLGRIEKRGPVILTTHRGKRPWTADGLRSSFAQVCQDAKVSRTFHDLRRTAATTLVSAGIDNTQVASIMGWSEADVEAMKRKYVSRAAVVSAVLAKLEKGG
jgi:integrase